jgi:predicted nucleic acid-binding protein
VIHAVLDVNVLVSGFPASTNAPALIINRWRAGQFQVAVSQHILAEVERAWSKTYWHTRFSPAQVDRALMVLRTDAVVVSVSVTVSGVASHPEDDRDQHPLASTVPGRAGPRTFGLQRPLAELNVQAVQAAGRGFERHPRATCTESWF